MTEHLVYGAFKVADMTGRSEFKVLRHELRKTQADLNLELDSIVEKSKVDGVALYLVKSKIFGAGDREDFKLRWRRRFSNTKHSYVRWVDQDEVLDAMVPVVRRHYEATNRRMKELNALSSIVRHNLSVVNAFLHARVSS